LIECCLGVNGTPIRCELYFVGALGVTLRLYARTRV
jgi:hypothetical protein